ncbi:MAG: hypothetical protein K6F53_02085 [Lachnospiraceae bacterium]|nr:hypothetical protein [Lachnospiraceae bacterium]
MKYSNVQKKAGDIMGGEVMWDLEVLQAYRKGDAEGMEKGKILARYEDGMPIEEIAVKMNKSVDFIREVLDLNLVSEGS